MRSSAGDASRSHPSWIEPAWLPYFAQQKRNRSGKGPRTQLLHQRYLANPVSDADIADLSSAFADDNTFNPETLPNPQPHTDSEALRLDILAASRASLQPRGAFPVTLPDLHSP
jgi:hypothetical protein